MVLLASLILTQLMMSFDIFKCEIQSTDNGELDRSTVSFANRKKLCNEDVKEINTKAVKQRGRFHMTRISHNETGLSKNYDIQYITRVVTPC